MPIDITEYTDLAAARSGHKVIAGQEPSILNQQVAVAGVSAQSAAFQDATRFIRVHSDVACRVAFGSSPSAAATSQRIPANGTEYFGVVPGHKLAVISSA
jgi:hypothetical protein